jgi:predicted TIM-barrel fold metal-dependent hydrolase
MIIDAHLHCTGRETTEDVLHTLDGAGIDVGVLLAPFLGDGYSIDDAQSLRRANAHLARLVKHHPDRLVGFAVVDPRDPDAAHDLRHAVETLGLRGVKMVPTGWHADEARVQPVFAVASELKLPVLFHSGIFIDGRSGRFCRPASFEVMRGHPGARVALAHVGWPWTDEAIAVALIDRIHGVPEDRCAFRLDISFGPPPPYRREVLARALDVIGAGLLQFGSDCFFPCSAEHVRERMGWVRDLFDQLALDAATRERLWSGTAAAWLGIATGPRLPPPPPIPEAGEEGAAPAAPAGSRAGASAGGEPSALPHPQPHLPRSPWARGWLGAPPSSARWVPRCC